MVCSAPSPIAGMTEGRGEAFKKNFLVTHFFNPVRYMKLLELVAATVSSCSTSRPTISTG